ncbi:MAG: arginase family protein [Ruminococcaceae bacterium]|nr:arginase family protein [Oscillospiraceae bacterium]
MKEKHMNLFFPQWQGAGIGKELLKGALEIKEKYLNGYEFIDIHVSRDDIAEAENNILGYRQIIEQFKTAKSVIAAEMPDRIFTVGGGCDIDVIPVSYLNKKLEGDLTVVWIDAHGDLNIPEQSPTKHFHGMPLRTLLGEGDPEIVKIPFSFLSDAQLMMLGQRDLDEPEKDYIEEHQITFLDVDTINSDMDCVLESVKAKGSNNIYVHIDLDVIDYDEFPYIKVPSPGGLKSQVLLNLLARLNDEFNIAGLSLMEYAGSDKPYLAVISEIIRIGTSL